MSSASPTDTKTRVTAVIAEHLALEVARVQPACTILGDRATAFNLGADSLDHVELVMAIEEEFAILISDEEARKLLTVQDVITHVQAKLHA